MADVTLEMLGRMVQQVLDDTREMKAKLGDVVVRLGRLEVLVAGLHEDFANLSVRVDRQVERLDRVERRLELIGPAPAAADAIEPAKGDE